MFVKVNLEPVGEWVVIGGGGWVSECGGAAGVETSSLRYDTFFSFLSFMFDVLNVLFL